jgi:hypothetical protein
MWSSDMADTTPQRFDDLARLASTSVSRRTILKAAGTTFLTSAVLGFPRLGLGLTSDASAQTLQQPTEECNNFVLGQACFGACFAAYFVCAGECAASLGIKCAACMGGVERCFRSCSKEADCHCVTGTPCRSSNGTPWGPAQCCAPDQECNAWNVCAPRCKSCEERNWLGDCVSKCSAGQTCCDGRCVDTMTDPTNCGSCGDACAPSEPCCLGACCSAIGSGTTDGGVCCPPSSFGPRCCPPGTTDCCLGPTGYACCGSGQKCCTNAYTQWCCDAPSSSDGCAQSMCCGDGYFFSCCSPVYQTCNSADGVCNGGGYPCNGS